MVRKDNFTKLFLKAEKLERNFVDRIDELIQRRVAIEDIKIRPQTLRLTTDEVASSTFILSTDEYIHPQSYLDGGYILWDGSTYTAEDTLVKVVNLNNTFIETFNHEDFINTSLTTGTISSSDAKIELDVDEVLVSEVVYKDTDSISQITLNLVSEDNSQFKAEYSTNGSAWTEFPIGEATSILSTTQLYYRITNNSLSGQGLLPLTLPGDLAVPDTADIFRVELTYS